MGKGQVYRCKGEECEEPLLTDRFGRARRLRELAAYNRARAEELEAEANEMVADDMREYVDGAELITVEA